MNKATYQPKSDYTLGIIGSGQLAKSYLTGLLASGFPLHRCVLLQRSSASSRFTMRHDIDTLLGVERTSELDKLPLDVVILAVKRKDIGGIAEALRRAGRRPGILLSAVAGMSSANLTEAFSPSLGIVRCMPNLGAAVRCSSTLVWPYSDLPESTKQVVDELFGSIGTIWPMGSESMLDGVTAFAAAGPAYIARMAVALERGGAGLGLDAATSAAIAKELCVSTGKLLDAPASSLCTLMAGVASPGGMTERGLDHLDAAGLDGDVLGAMRRSLSIAGNLK
jgi:pyrroline-5-carboxylate reductase